MQQPRTQYYISQRKKSINIFVIDASEKIQSTIFLIILPQCTLHAHCGDSVVILILRNGHKFEIFNIASLRQRKKTTNEKEKQICEYIGSIEQLNTYCEDEQAKSSQFPVYNSSQLFTMFEKDNDFIFIFVFTRYFFCFCSTNKTFPFWFYLLVLLALLLNISSYNDKGGFDGSGTSIIHVNQAICNYIWVHVCVHCFNNHYSHFRNSLGIQFNLKSSAHVKLLWNSSLIIMGAMSIERKERLFGVQFTRLGVVHYTFFFFLFVLNFHFQLADI